MDCRILATTPEAQPDLWAEFVEGAQHSYAHFGVETALEYDRIVDGTSTRMFFAALDGSGRMRGGLRVQGPYAHPHHTHADEEWAGSPPGQAALRTMVADRLSHGVVEMKTVWTAPDAPRPSVPGYLGAVGATLAATALGSRFTLATSAEHSVGPYLDSGAVMAAHIDAVPYPDDRYRTRVLWWDQRALASITSEDWYRRIRFAVAGILGRTSLDAKAAAS